jgi:UDP-glucose 4-epimerase
MEDNKVVLVTGVAGFWGAEVARSLIAHGAEQGSYPADNEKPAGVSASQAKIIGVDNDPLKEPIEGLDFVQVDIQNPMFVELLKSEQIDIVCHLDFEQKTHRSEKTFVHNVLGTMKLIGACAESGVRKVVLKSSTMVYGADWNNPAFLTEEHTVQGSKRYGYTRDLVEIESFCTGFCQQSPGIVVTRLRFPGIIGPQSETPMNHYLKLKVVPVLFGFDPMMQVIHETDVVRALIHVIEVDRPGAYNVAAEGVLPLRGIIGRAGKLPLPIIHPLAYLAADLISATRLPVNRTMPIEWDYLRYPWVADIRRMRQELEFAPSFSAKEVLADFSRHMKLERFNEESAEFIRKGEYIQDIIALRNRNRAREEHSGKG